MTVTGKDLIGSQFDEGRALGIPLDDVNAQGLDGQRPADQVRTNDPAPGIGLQCPPGCLLYLEAVTEDEGDDLRAVLAAENGTRPGGHPNWQRYCMWPDLSDDGTRKRGLMQTRTRPARAVMVERIRNEHDFVFTKGDLYSHAKAVPAVDQAFLADRGGTQIFPLNVGQSVLRIRGERPCHAGDGRVVG